MTPQKQLLRHDPDNGVYGDCHRAALASILDIPVAEVPHFAADDPDAVTFNQRVDAYLASRGLCRITSEFGGASLGRILRLIQTLNPGVYFLLTGRSATGCNHTVVACDGEIVHDPSPTDAGIVGPCDDGLYWCVFLGAAIAKKPAGSA